MWIYFNKKILDIGKKISIITYKWLLKSLGMNEFSGKSGEKNKLWIMFLL